MSNHRNIPYVPPPTRRASVSLKYCYERPIAYAVQMRGDLDDLPTIIYYGAPWHLLIDVMKYVSRCMGDALKGYVIKQEHSCRWKNGKAYRRMSIEIHGLDEQFMSLESLLMVIHNYMKRICWCKVKELPLKKLLNL